ncbi:MAG: hypothetical protein J6C17_03635 [Clostridia bacterium]|nr:hypothetical protein [Clostridia bacterium]
MEEIFFYDFHFDFLCSVPDFISVNLTEYFNKVGTAEIHIPKESEKAHKILDTDFLVACYKGHSFIITTKVYEEDLTLYGRTMNFILTKRVTDSNTFNDAFLESSVRKLIKSSFIDSSIVRLNDSHFILGESIENTSKITCAIYENENLSEVVCEMLDTQNLGHSVTFDTINKKWIFSLLKGKEIRDIILSPENRNAHNLCYTHDILDYINTTRNTTVGTDRDLTGLFAFQGTINVSGTERKKDKIKRLGRKKRVTVKTSDFIHGRDYNLGDTVRVQMRIGDKNICITKKIIGVSKWAERGEGIGEEPILED